MSKIFADKPKTANEKLMMDTGDRLYEAANAVLKEKVTGTTNNEQRLAILRGALFCLSTQAGHVLANLDEGLNQSNLPEKEFNNRKQVLMRELITSFSSGYTAVVEGYERKKKELLAKKVAKGTKKPKKAAKKKSK
jgi:hypothetical protein